MEARTLLSRLHIPNIIGIATTHSLGFVGLWYLSVNFIWQTAALAVLWYCLCNLSIAAGYHRYYAHRSYETTRWGRWIDLYFLGFGSAAFQGPADWWASVHIVHHQYTDTERDPHSITRGFLWAHMGWLFYRSLPIPIRKSFRKSRMLRFQHKYHVVIGSLVGFVVPAAIASLWNDPWGGVLVAGFFRLMLQYHTTWSVNSFAHFNGTHPFEAKSSATDSWWNAWISFGEAAGHNFHHKYDWVWWQSRRILVFEPARWFIWVCAKTGFVELKRVPEKIVLEAERA